MAINFTDFSRAPLLDSPAKDIFENVLKGYQISQEPGKMQQQSTARDLANKLRELEVGHKPKEYELGDQGTSLANALKQKALEHYEDKLQMEKDYKQALINKALGKNQNSTLELSKAKEEQKINLKKKEDLLALAKHLYQTGQDVSGIQDLLTQNKNLTGVGTGIKRFLGAGNAEQGSFNEKALRLQADLARLISQRGGAVAAGLAAQGKPSLWANNAYNLGITKSMQDRIENEFGNLQKEYKDLTGEDLPYDLNDVFHQATQHAAALEEVKKSDSNNDMVPMIAPNGKRALVPRDRVEAALAAGGKLG